MGLKSLTKPSLHPDKLSAPTAITDTCTQGPSVTSQNPNKKIEQNLKQSKKNEVLRSKVGFKGQDAYDMLTPLLYTVNGISRNPHGWPLIL